MSAQLRLFIAEYISTLVDESRIRRDDDGDNDLVIRKLVKFRKPGTKFQADDNVDAQVRQDGALIVNDDEVWLPDLGDPAHPHHRFAKRMPHGSDDQSSE